jgi:hypothetical protein
MPTIDQHESRHRAFGRYSLPAITQLLLKLEAIIKTDSVPRHSCEKQIFGAKFR